MRLSIQCGVLALALLVAWPQTSAVGQEVKLGSGKTVEIIGLGPLQGTQGPPALMLKYRTKIPLTDVPALRIEVDEIWDRFVVDLERTSFQSAVISANGPETGTVVTTNQAFNFTFEKQDGTWRSPDWKPGAQPRLTPELVKQFIARVDHAYKNSETNAVQLMMAGDWVVTLTRPRASPPSRQTTDRPTFLAALRVLATASSRKYQREITKVSVSNDGMASTVESVERETITINGRETELVAESTDRLEIRGNAVLLVESSSVVTVEKVTRSN